MRNRRIVEAERDAEVAPAEVVVYGVQVLQKLVKPPEVLICRAGQVENQV